MKIRQPTEPFSCSDLYIAAFLIAKGLELLNIDKTDSKRALFQFNDSEYRERWLMDYWSKKALVEPRSFILAIKEAKDRLYS